MGCVQNVFIQRMLTFRMKFIHFIEPIKLRPIVIKTIELTLRPPRDSLWFIQFIVIIIIVEIRTTFGNAVQALIKILAAAYIVESHKLVRWICYQHATRLQLQ